MAKSPVKDVSATSVDQMETIRAEFKGLFRTSMTIGFSTIVVVQLSTALVLLVNLAFESDKAAVLFGLARMLQLSLGIFIGFFIVFLGLLAAWLGIQGSVTASATMPKATVALVGATPGVVLMVSGTVILAVCLMKEVHATHVETTRETGGTTTRQPMGRSMRPDYSARFAVVRHYLSDRRD